ncbi:MAG TPA: hypothetical protein VFR93_00920 [Candidatus Limnocylindrales bacterium]|nr:hypothetical protein [Candidatus Limnocylindrales bacterium]
MTERRVGAFLPSRNGFPWPNAWPHVAPIRIGVGPLSIGIGDAARGLCGGMVFTVADLAVAGLPTPPDRQPAPETPRFRYVVRRQVQSFDWLRLPLRFYALMAAPLRWRASRSRAAWEHVRAEIDGGRLAMLGLVRIASRNPLALTGNHQVVAWRYAVDGATITLGIYDPNHPGADDVELRLTLSADTRSIDRFAQSTGEPLVGLLAAPYAPADPRPFRSGAG